jgi:O-antigen ligase
LFGCGLNTYSKVVKDYKNFEFGEQYPHNSFLQKTAETGLLGLFAFLLVLFSFFMVSVRHILLYANNNTLVLGLLSGISAFLLHGFFESNLYALQLVVLFWFMLGLTMAVINLEKPSLV